ncbi:VanZ family protein [Spirosoma litoris]
MRLIYIMLIIGTALILYLSWQPNYHFKHIWFIPGWVSRWTDVHAHGNIRTAIPFVFMGLVAGFLPTSTPRSLFNWLVLWLILIGIVTLAEIGQLLIPSRYPSVEDIGWGSVGAFVGLGTAFIVVSGIRKLKSQNK